ncbi:hypothetical protein [Nocardioides antri]|uniref:Uncharacterized protein n=1 Tax=Nocardioides antri TaxID=2607659 RepID=A0A5B1LV61_9ACTN|nr:hypothetical protein [Nocardioides antri]KAA1424028.1 hypothetical protein F0U47_20080 [Nocardioides antri]
MAEPLTVSIADLRAALLRALDATEKRLGPEVALDVDYYWHLAVEDAFNMAGEPQTFTVGQVSDDLEEAVQDEHDRLPEEASHDLSHLVGVLRALEFAARS